jgi:hypothetical protein
MGDDFPKNNTGGDRDREGEAQKPILKGAFED